MSSGNSSPMNGGFEGSNSEPARRLTVRKDLFPEVRLSKLMPEETTFQDELEDISCVNLETDFEQSIDDIQKMQKSNGIPPAERPRHRKHKQHSHRSSECSTTLNGSFAMETKRRKSSPSKVKPHRTHSHHTVPKVKGGKNLNLVSSSKFQNDSDDNDSVTKDEENTEEDSSEDEVLKCSVKLPVYSVQRQSGKPYSHELSQLSSKKSKSRDCSKEQRTTHTVTPCSGKPRSMLGIRSSHSKKKKKADRTATYQSLIVDTNIMKIKIRRTSIHEVAASTLTSVADIGQRKSKKKRAASPVASESSGEEYDPSRGDTAAVVSVAAPKPRHPPAKSKRTTSTKNKGKSEKTERVKVAQKDKETANQELLGPQSPWGETMPEEVLVKIFEYAVEAQGSLPTVVRLGRVCKLWHSVSCRPELWRNMDLAQHTVEKFKTDFKLVWLLENRLSKCHSLNIAHWKVCNETWVLACVADYCRELRELSVAGWSRLLPDQLYELFHSLPHLQRIDLSQTSEQGGSGSCLSAASMSRLMESFGSRITHLTLANNKFTALQQILTSIASHCCNLEVLDLSGAAATAHPAAVPLEALQRGCPRLRVFRAANAQIVLHPAPTHTQDVEGWTELEELSIAGESTSERVTVGEYRLGDDALSRLVRGATRLKLLDLRGLQRLTGSGLVRIPAWDLQHLFLGGCNVSRSDGACLELICEKWSHSLLELDLAWASAARALDDAVAALADAKHSQLRILNLCGSSVTLEPVKKVVLRCQHLESLNLSSCRGLPRGMKRLLTGKELQDLKDSFDPEKIKAKQLAEEQAKNKKSDAKKSTESRKNTGAATETKLDTMCQDQSSSTVFQEPKSVPSDSKQSDISKTSPDSKSDISSKDGESLQSPATPKLLSPIVQSKPDSSSTPRSECSKTDGSPYFSPASKPDSQVQNSPDLHPESVRSNSSWNLGQFKTTPTHRSEASPLNRMDCKILQAKTVEQCSPTTSQENKPSPENHPLKQDIKSANYYGGYSPMTRQEFSSQRSPYSAQPSPAQPSPYSTQPSPAQPSPYSTNRSPAQPSPYSTQRSPAQPSPYSTQRSPAQPSPYSTQRSPAQPSPYSTQRSPAQPSPYSAHPSPYSTQPSPYSSQPSPYSAQPSPDTSQIAKSELQKCQPQWNPGAYSPMPKQPSFSPQVSMASGAGPLGAGGAGWAGEAWGAAGGWGAAQALPDPWALAHFPADAAALDAHLAGLIEELADTSRLD